MGDTEVDEPPVTGSQPGGFGTAWLHWLVLAVCAAGIATAGWGAWRAVHPPRDHGDADVWNADVGFASFPPSKRKPAPAVEGRTLEGDRLDLDHWRGSVIVLNVWGSWCVPCRKEAPFLAKVSKETAAVGVRFVGFDVRDNPAAGLAFERRYGIGYPSFDDPGARLLARFAGTIPISAVPSTVFLDKRGRIAARVVGQIDESTLRQEIDSLLREEPAS